MCLCIYFILIPRMCSLWCKKLITESWKTQHWCIPRVLTWFRNTPPNVFIAPAFLLSSFHLTITPLQAKTAWQWKWVEKYRHSSNIWSVFSLCFQYKHIGSPTHPPAVLCVNLGCRSLLFKSPHFHSALCFHQSFLIPSHCTLWSDCSMQQ